ncbi:MAG: hypothetical protein RMJ19_04340, partial [Gemmatales bacterium]|nr:hypothetical protein [Gemmatales bacterium]MDW8174877.1 hypothetical protein [Gemmatales bacterium]
RSAHSLPHHAPPTPYRILLRPPPTASRSAHSLPYRDAPTRYWIVLRPLPYRILLHPLDTALLKSLFRMPL